MTNNIFYKFENYIFDLDGTIINSADEVIRCLETACNEVGAEYNQNKLTSDLIGPPLRDIIKNLIIDYSNETLVSQVEQSYSNLYDYDENDSSFLYEDVYKWAQLLKHKGKRLFIATNKPKIPTIRLAKKFQLDIFEDIYTIDIFDKKITNKAEMIEDIIQKHKLKKAQTVMVGDALSDVKSAQTANIEAISVLWGYEKDKKTLKAASKYAITIRDLKDYLLSC